MSRELMIPAADTRLYAVDDPGGTPALLFIGGGFGTVQNWSRVIRLLDGKYRSVRFDARARGKSGKSGDYSIQAAVDDVGRVIDATDVERPILVGGSRRHARGALRGPAPRAGRRTGAHRRRLPDHHVRRGRQGEDPHPVPPAGVAHAHRGGARPLGPDVSRRVRGGRDRDGRRQRRTRPRLRRVGMPDRVRGWHRSPLGRHRGRDAHGAGCCHRRRWRATSACPYSQRRPTNTPRSSTRPPTPSSPRSRTSSTGLPERADARRSAAGRATRARAEDRERGSKPAKATRRASVSCQSRARERAARRECGSASEGCEGILERQQWIVGSNGSTRLRSELLDVFHNATAEGARRLARAPCRLPKRATLGTQLAGGRVTTRT